MLSLACIALGLALTGVNAQYPTTYPGEPSGGYPGAPSGGAPGMTTAAPTSTAAPDPGAASGTAHLGPIGGNAGVGYNSAEGGHGHLQGSIGPFSGIVGGEIGGAAGPEGCAGGAFMGLGYTQCLPAAESTVILKERVAIAEITAAPKMVTEIRREARPVGYTQSLGFGPAGGEAGGGVGEPGFHGHLSGHIAGASGLAAGTIGPGGSPEGCLGGAVDGVGATGCAFNPNPTPFPG